MLFEMYFKLRQDNPKDLSIIVLFSIVKIKKIKIKSFASIFLLPKRLWKGSLWNSSGFYKNLYNFV